MNFGVKILGFMSVALLIAGCGGGDSNNANTDNKAFVGRWGSSCGKAVDANGVELPVWGKFVSEFTSQGEVVFEGVTYSDAACTSGAVATTAPVFSWVKTDEIVDVEGVIVNQLLLTSKSLQGSSYPQFKISLAVRNNKLCFSSNVKITSTTFGVSAWAENLDAVDFNNCLVPRQ